MGLHPKIQRRLIDIIKHESKLRKKQFIITTHSPSIVSSFSKNSRLFIEKKSNGDSCCYENLSIQATLTRMDSVIYPAINVVCEDKTACCLIRHSLNKFIPRDNIRLVNVLEMGSANDVYRFFKLTQKANESLRVPLPVCCILDGDMKNKRDSNQALKYPQQISLYFIDSDDPPEALLLRSYLNENPNETLSYHLDRSNPHCLYEKCVEQSLAATRDEVRSLLIEQYANTASGKSFMQRLAIFINSHIENSV